MGGGREIPILMSTAAIAGIGTTITNANRIVPTSNLFILLPPFSMVLDRQEPAPDTSWLVFRQDQRSSLDPCHLDG